MPAEPPQAARILMVDDEAEALQTLALVLSMQGFVHVRTCTDARLVLGHIESEPVDLLLLDISMPHLSGLELLSQVAQQYPAVIVLMVTGHNDAAMAVNCLRLGAYDYLVKPLDQTRLLTTVRKALAHKAAECEAERVAEQLLGEEPAHPEWFAEIITVDPRMRNIFKYVEAIAPTDLPMLITGETGVGKELIAKAIHRASKRPGEFVCVNSAGIDDNLFSDTLFGHVPGAFTGAQRERRGLIERAAGGTLFLDEIGDMKPESQVKLLRLLQERTYYRLGSEAEEKTTARIVAATNRGIEVLQTDSSFRKDLFYRLKSHRVNVPPLRERAGDLPLLVEAFVASAAESQGKAKPVVPRELLPLLANYAFPGNVRELQGLVFDAVGRHTRGVLSCSSFREALGITDSSSTQAQALSAAEVVFPSTLPRAAEVELALVREALRRTGGNKKLAAEMIGMARQTFRSKVKLL